MLARMIVVLLSLGASPAWSVDYTDLWYNRTESGWGVNVIQSDTFQFLTFFIYGPDGKPTWYSANLVLDATGSYVGALYATTGTHFAAPWQGAVITAAGSASFQPTSPYDATLTYTLDGAGAIVKSIERQTLTAVPLAGSYSGSVAGSVTGCTRAASNVAVLQHRISIAVTQSDPLSATMTHTLVENGAVCRFTGPLTQRGKFYQMLDARYSCDPNPAIKANVEELAITAHGIEGRWTADDGGGCIEAIRFSAVRN